MLAEWYKRLEKMDMYMALDLPKDLLKHGIPKPCAIGLWLCVTFPWIALVGLPLMAIEMFVDMWSEFGRTT